MTPARFQTIEEIFLAALEQEPDQVSAFVDTACEGDALDIVLQHPHQQHAGPHERQQLLRPHDGLVGAVAARQLVDAREPGPDYDYVEVGPGDAWLVGCWANRPSRGRVASLFLGRNASCYFAHVREGAVALQGLRLLSGWTDELEGGPRGR